MSATWKGKLAGLSVMLWATELLTTPAHAALSPLYQSISEIETILADQRLTAAFANQEAVISISSTANDTYEVRTKSCAVTVTVVDVPNKPVIAGPRRFDLEFGNATCQ